MASNTNSKQKPKPQPTVAPKNQPRSISPSSNRSSTSTPSSPILSRGLTDFFSEPAIPDRKYRSSRLPSPTNLSFDQAMLDVKTPIEEKPPATPPKDIPPPTTNAAEGGSNTNTNNANNNNNTPTVTSTATATTTPSSPTTNTSTTNSTVAADIAAPAKDTPSAPAPTNGSIITAIIDETEDVIMDDPVLTASDAAMDQASSPALPPRPSIDVSGTLNGTEIVASENGEVINTSGKSSPVSLEKDLQKLRNKVEELEMLNDSLRNNLQETVQVREVYEREYQRATMNCSSFAQQNNELRELLAKKERDYEVMSKNYLEHVRLIRATDDDHSTIMEKLTYLKASIEHLIRKAQGGRSVNLVKEAAIENFKSSGLLEKFPVAEDKLEPYHLNLYMESVVMKILVTRFFDQSLSCLVDFNPNFQEIYGWMEERNPKAAVRWRQQLCQMIAQDPATKQRQEKEVKAAAESLTELFTKVYQNSNESNKIQELCTKAIELAIAMKGLASPILPTYPALETPFDEESMSPSLKSNPEGKIALVVFPSFQDSTGFSMRPKVWCN
ncbi:hypothetical protein DFQ27_008562 [Actinomortierella ambigua]|uniref:Uncharacterized protein n=1 Tax=Actinomortierella ambigua TaxID=1343610 RepID=A0A9P6TY91_9FUNG|nr:hypothetical protein DFQ26_004876 [Actinomortierella ambigua]KAG0251780.1 hypothetical protein DFQ27_008562 [Actinomortierella ambigua]